MMEGREAKMATGGGARPASPMDFLENTINEMREVTECLHSVLVRTHNNAFGEYQDNPQTGEDEVPDEPGRVNEFRRQVRSITEGARHTLRIAESLESHG